MSAGYIVLIILGSLLFLYWAGGLAIAIILFFHGRRTDDQIIEYEVAEKGFDIKLLDIPCKRFTYIQGLGTDCPTLWGEKATIST